MLDLLKTLTPEGLVVLGAIFLMSVAALGLALERLRSTWLFRRRIALAADRIVEHLRGGNRTMAEAVNSSLPWHPAVDLFKLLLGSASLPPTQVKRAQARIIRDAKVRLWLVGTIGATAPFVGLFGTVLGVMEAFRNIGAQGIGGFAVVSSGISEALVTTAGGIGVGVEAMFLFNFLQVQAANFAAELREATDEIVEAKNGTSHGDASAAAS